MARKKKTETTTLTEVEFLMAQDAALTKEAAEEHIKSRPKKKEE